MSGGNKNIIIINHYQSSSKYGYSSRFESLGRVWAQAGCNVICISASFSHLYVASPRFKGIIGNEFIDGIHYVFLRVPKYIGNGVGRLMNMLFFVVQLFLYLPYFYFRFRPDCVLASSVYLLDTFPAYALARLSRAKFVREIRDLWPLTLVELGVASPHEIKTKVLNCSLKFSIKKADAIVSTLPYADLYFKELGLDHKRFECVPQCLIEFHPPISPGEMPSFHKAQIDQFRSRVDFLIGFVGTLGIGDTLPVLMDAAKILMRAGVGFVIVGEGPGLSDHLRFVEYNKVDNVIFLPKTSRRESAAILGEMDALYMGWESRRIYRFGISPNRLLDYMLSSKPIIHARDYGNDPVDEANCGISIPSNDPIALVDSILKLKKMEKSDRILMGGRGFEYVNATHSCRKLAERYLNIL